MVIAPSAIFGQRFNTQTNTSQQSMRYEARAVVQSPDLGKKITFAQFAEEAQLEPTDLAYLKDKLGVQGLHVKICHNVNTTYCRVLDIGNRSCARFQYDMQHSPQFRHWHVDECFTAANGRTYVTIQLTVAEDRRRQNLGNYE